jgi:phosphopantetheinyl transferase
MPLFLYKSIENAEIAVWQVTEDENYFKNELEAHHFPVNLGENINHPEKRRQWYASRYLLCEIFPGAIQTYRQRKPFLYNGPEISFSHSEDMVALMLSSFKSGIDIQGVNKKLERIAPKFVNPSDLKAISVGDYTEQLCTIWSIKEAVFKYYTTELPFKQIRVMEYDLEDGKATIEVMRHGKLQNHLVSVLNLGDFTMAYVLE